MTYNEYVDYVKGMNALFDVMSDDLEKIELEDKCLSLRFLRKLNALLTNRMDFCKTCSKYWRDLSGRCFRFMRKKCIEHAQVYEDLHRETLHQRINVEIRISQILYNKDKV